MWSRFTKNDECFLLFSLNSLRPILNRSDYAAKPSCHISKLRFGPNTRPSLFHVCQHEKVGCRMCTTSLT